MGPPEHQGSADPDPRYVQVDHVLGRAAGARRRLRYHRSEHAGRGSGGARATGRAVQARAAGEPGHAGQATGLAMTRKSVGAASAASSLMQRRVTTEKLRSEEHTSELQSPMRSSYAVFCLTKNT